MNLNFKKTISLVLIFLIIASTNLFVGIPSGVQEVFADSPSTVNITVQNTVKDIITEGVGWTAENNWVSANHVDGSTVWDDETWDRYNNLVAFLKPQLIRFGVSVPYWSPSYGTYTYDSNWMLNNYKQLDAIKEMGADVIWSNWWASSNAPDNYWWSEVTRNGGVDPNNFPRDDHPYDVSKFTEAIADSIAYLRNIKGYTNIKYVSLWNEPNHSYVSPTASYPDTFWAMYSPLATALTNKGVRNDVAIIGPEIEAITVNAPNIKTYVKNPEPGTQQYGQVVDNISIHDYNSVFDYDTRSFGDSTNWVSTSDILNIMNDMRASVNNTYTTNGKPSPSIFISEFGNTCWGPGYVNEKSSNADGGLLSAELTIRYLALGYDGMCRWNVSAYKDAYWPTNSVFRPISYSALNSGFSINSPSYYSGAIISRYMTKGSSVYNYTISGAGDPARVFIAPLKGTDGKWTFFLVNDDFTERQVSLDLNGLGIDNGTIFNEFEWSAGTPDGIHCNQALAYMGNVFNVSLQPRSVMAFTMRGETEFIPGVLLNVDEEGIDGVVANNGFENGTLTPWEYVSNAGTQKYTDGSCHSGNFMATLNTSLGDGELKQTVQNMSPGNYVLTCYAKTDGNGHDVKVAVKFNGTEISSATTSNFGWTKLSIPFSIPSNGGYIEVVITSPYKSASWANVDDFGISQTYVANSGFETGSTSGWTISGNANLDYGAAGANTGSYFATLNTSIGDGEVSQTVTNLKPGNYILRTRVRTGNNTAYLGVRNFDGSKNYSKSASSWYYQTVSIPFTVPLGGSSATVYISGAYTPGTSWVNVDDTEIIPEVGLLNGGFEEDTPLLWSSCGSAARDTAGSAHSGTVKAVINSGNGAGGFSQTVTGLLPGNYCFVGYVRTDGTSSARIRVSGYGGSDVIASTSNSHWTRLYIDFTIPNGYDSATVNFEAAESGTGTFSYGDDFELRCVEKANGVALLPNTIQQSDMTASATSQGHPVSNAIDNDSESTWSSALNTNLPQSIILDLKGTYSVNELRYLPQQFIGNNDGIITGYNIYVSTDGINFTLVTSGTWPYDCTEKSATFASLSASYIKLEATAVHGEYAMAAEINVRHNGDLPAKASGGCLVLNVTNDNNPGNHYFFNTFSTASYTFQAGDYIEYDVKNLVNGSGIGGIDCIASDGTTFGGASGWADQNGIAGNPSADLSSKAYDKWYHRKLAVPGSMIGKTAARWDIAGEYQTADASYTTMYDNIVVTNQNGTEMKAIYKNGTDITTNYVDIYQNASGKMYGLYMDPAAMPQPAGDCIKYDVTVNSTMPHYYYNKFSTDSYVFQAGDYIEYDVELTSNVPGTGGIEIVNTDGSFFRDSSGWTDQNGLGGHPSADITSKACNTWYHRRLPVPTSMVGKTSSHWSAAGEWGVNNLSFSALYDNVVVTDGNGTERELVFRSASDMNINAPYQASNASVTMSIAQAP